MHLPIKGAWLTPSLATVAGLFEQTFNNNIMSTTDFDAAVASRGTSTSPFGKVESPLKTLVDEDTHTAFLLSRVGK